MKNLRKVAIIGLGHVGHTVAHTLVERNLVDQLVLFDKEEKLVIAETNDLIDGQIGKNLQVKFPDSDEKEFGDCDIIIFAAGDISILHGTNADRFTELNYTKTVAAEWAPKIKQSGFNGILLSITNPCDVITQYLQELTGLSKNQVFGTGTTLDTARMKHAVSQALDIHPSAIEGYVLGEHGESQFVGWSNVRIAGTALTDSHSQEHLDALEKAARNGGWVTITGKGYTCFGIANQAAILVEAILNDNQLIAPVSNFSEIEQVYVGHPAKISKKGIVKEFPLHLNELEKEKWQKTIETIKYMHSTI